MPVRGSFIGRLLRRTLVQPYCSVQVPGFNIELLGGKLEELPCSGGGKSIVVAENSGELALHHHIWFCFGADSCIHDQV